jgi:hypothetical protein
VAVSLPAFTAIMPIGLALMVLTMWLFLLSYRGHFTGGFQNRADRVLDGESRDKAVNILRPG